MPTPIRQEPQPAAEELRDVAAVERALLSRIERGALRVPPYPSVALKLRKLVSQENYGLDAVLALVSTDAALVADVLRCANAAFFGRGTVSSLQQAVGRVGATQVTRLALVSGLSGLVRAPGPLAGLRREAWGQSLSSAALSQTLAPLRKLAGESAFVAGLLHDFGWLIGISAIEEMLAAMAAPPERSERFWKEAIERCHTQLGLQLASRWNLPALLIDAISLHHEAAPVSEFAPLVELVATCDRVLGLLQDEPVISEAALRAIAGLTAAERAALLQAIPQLPELVSAFDSEPQATAPLARSSPGAAAPPPALPEGFKPFDCPVSQLSPRRRGPFSAFGLAASALLMRGREPLPEKQLVELELSAAAPFRLWAKVVACTSDAGGFRIECRPFALSGPVLEQWRALA